MGDMFLFVASSGSFANICIQNGQLLLCTLQYIISGNYRIIRRQNQSEVQNIRK
jgi:hypothetical protein